MNTKIDNTLENNYYINSFLKHKNIKTALFFVLSFFLANIGAIVDKFTHPEISYFDIEHIIVGSIIFLSLITSYVILYIYYNNLVKDNFIKSNIVERFKYISETTNDIVIFSDSIGHILKFNNKTSLLYEFSEEDLTKKNISEIIFQNNELEFNETSKKIIENDGLIFESKFIKSDGSTLITEVSSKSIEIDKKRYFQYIVKDISERKRIDRELKESEEKFRTILENSNDLIWSLDKNGCFVWANKKAEEVSGYTLDEVFGNHFENYMYSEDVKIAYNSFKKVLLGENQCYELRAIKKNNEIYNLLINSGPFKHNGEIIGSIAFAKDVTQLKITQKELEITNKFLKISEERFRSLTESSSAGIFLHNGEHFEFVNKTVTEGTGFTKEEMYDMKFFEIIHPDDRQMVIDYWKRRSNGEDVPNKYECKLVTKDGHMLWSEISAKLIEFNNVKYLIGTAFNITERKVVEESLKIANSELIVAKNKAEESDKLKTSFLNNISHEIRTPMNAIIGFSELMNDENLLPDKRKQYLGIIKSSTNQLLSIITDIISLSNIQAGKERLRIKELNLNELLNNLLQQIAFKYSKDNLLVKQNFELLDNNSVINTDETKLTQIVTNLLVNAFKFTVKGEIEVGYFIKEKWLEIYVKDSGIGIEEGAHEKIFERFAQANPSISVNYGGTGLGLSISKNFVELFGGKIWLKSKINEGSTFFFTIPYNKVSKSSNEESETKLKGKNKTVLIAEDEDANFLLLKAILSKSNFNIIHASNGIEALELFKITPEIFLIIMDLKMPLMSGIEATKQIREINKNIPIIAQTAYAQDEDRIIALDRGCSDFIPKPIIKNDLLNIINKYL